VSLKFFKELQEHGADSVLRREYGGLLTDVEPGSYEHYIISS
jgi:hypothetical protein